MPSSSPSPSELAGGTASGFSFSMPGISLQIAVDPVALVLVVLAIAIVSLMVARTYGDRTVEVTVDIPLGGLGRLTFNADREVARLAHQAWIELATRKAGIPFDEEHDVVEEVFNSWYDLFKELRRLSKSVPPPSLRTKHARILIKTLVDAMNLGLRPVLTHWQARHRAWLVAERKRLNGEWEDPQVTQRRYPYYEEMLVDIRAVNGKLRAFADALDQIAQRATKEAEKGGE